MLRRCLAVFMACFAVLMAPLTVMAVDQVDSVPYELGSYFDSDHTLIDADTGYYLYVNNSPIFTSLLSANSATGSPASSAVYTLLPLDRDLSMIYYMTGQGETLRLEFTYTISDYVFRVRWYYVNSDGTYTVYSSNSTKVTLISEDSPGLFLGWYFLNGYIYVGYKQSAATNSNGVQFFSLLSPSSSFSNISKMYIKGTIVSDCYILGFSEPDITMTTDFFKSSWVALYSRCASTQNFLNWYYVYRNFDNISDSLGELAILGESLSSIDSALNDDIYDQIQGDNVIDSQPLPTPDYSAANQLDSISSDYNDQAFDAIQSTFDSGFSLTGVWNGAILAANLLQYCFNGLPFYQAFLVVMVLFCLLGFVTGVTGFLRHHSYSTRQARSGSEGKVGSDD